MNTRLLRAKEVMHLTGLTKATMYRLIDQGRFPKQIHISDKVVAWDSNAIDQWITERINEAKYSHNTK